MFCIFTLIKMKKLLHTAGKFHPYLTNSKPYKSSNNPSHSATYDWVIWSMRHLEELPEIAIEVKRSKSKKRHKKRPCGNESKDTIYIHYTLTGRLFSIIHKKGSSNNIIITV